ncbi:MAG: hypothetical protein H0W08_06390 [Acidobacteria bacterium]|nr:hypothetical protein [Acidobacteriota bacterium]
MTMSTIRPIGPADERGGRVMLMCLGLGPGGARRRYEGHAKSGIDGCRIEVQGPACRQ